VAAAFQTPVLLTIAQDLTQMRVVAAVDEADVGAVAVGQPATFTVDAYPGREFRADVTELRTAPQVVQNVVSYDAVLEVENADLSLKPGMTASVHVLTGAARDVVVVPNAGLRFSPPDAEAPEGPGVWRLDGQEPAWVGVVPGLSDGKSTAVEDGPLAPGDTVLTGLTTAGRKAYGLDHGRER
jgi:HlyD family secretion protein